MQHLPAELDDAAALAAAEVLVDIGRQADVHRGPLFLRKRRSKPDLIIPAAALVVDIQLKHLDHLPPVRLLPDLAQLLPGRWLRDSESTAGFCGNRRRRRLGLGRVLIPESGVIFPWANQGMFLCETARFFGFPFRRLPPPCFPRSAVWLWSFSARCALATSAAFSTWQAA